MKNISTQRIGKQRVFRSSNGRFVRSPRARITSKTRQAARPVSTIRNGSLYEYKGQVVRALQICNNGLRLVGLHGSLFGFAKDSELGRISIERVNKYLNH